MAYTRVNWEDGSTSHNTPISAENLNKMDAGIKELDTNKANKSGGDFTGDISVNLSGDASKPYITTDYANGAIQINDKHGSSTDYKMGRVVRTNPQYTYEQVYPNKSGTFVVTDGDGNTDLGSNTIESGVTHSVAEGYSNTLDDNWTDACHVEGFYNVVSGAQTHAEGHNNTASGDYSHAEGDSNTVSGQSAHAEGYTNTVTALYGHAEGGANTVSGEAAHAEGTNNTASGARAHAEGGGTEATADSSHAEGANTDAYGIASHAEGGNRNADGSGISSERTVTIGDETVSVLGPKAVGVCAHAEGVRTLAYGYASHASGKDTNALGAISHAEGLETTASGQNSRAEGTSTTASGAHSHAEGSETTATADSSHAEGYSTTASGTYAHTEGARTTANNRSSHAEGYDTTASGQYAHAEGASTTASGEASHAQNSGTTAGYANQTAMGTYNDNKSTNLLEVGNGEGAASPSNAMEVTADGDLLIKNGGVSLHGLDENKEVLGAKNLLPLSLEMMKEVNIIGTWSNNVYTYVGVTFTVNTDDYGNVLSIDIDTTNKTATSYISFELFRNKTVTLPENCIYTISASANNDNFNSSVFSGEDTLGSIAGASATTGSVEISATSFDRVNVYMGLSGTIITTLYPMIRLATDPNPTYRPYAMSNQELTSNVNTLNINKELFGVKNLLPMTLSKIKELNTSGTWNDNVFSNSNGTIEVLTDTCGNVIGFNVNGAFTGTVWFSLVSFTLTQGEYILSGGAVSNLGIYGQGDTPFANWNSTEAIPEAQKEFNSAASGIIYLRVIATEYNNAKVYPMIRLATDPNPTYRPYAMSNQELTQRLLALEARLS